MASETMRTLTPQDAAKVPQPGLIHPVNISFSPDDALITFLLSPDRSRTLQLYVFDPADRRAWAVLWSRPAPERPTKTSRWKRRCVANESGSGARGVTDYAWAQTAPRLLVPLPDGVYVQDAAGLRKVIDAPARGRSTFSPDGGRIAFVRAGDIYVVDAAGRATAPDVGRRRRGRHSRSGRVHRRGGDGPLRRVLVVARRATGSHSPKSTSATSRSIASSIRARTRSARPRRKIIAIRSPAKRMPSSALASCPFRPARRPG